MKETNFFKKKSDVPMSVRASAGMLAERPNVFVKNAEAMHSDVQLPNFLSRIVINEDVDKINKLSSGLDRNTQMQSSENERSKAKVDNGYLIKNITVYKALHRNGFVLQIKTGVKFNLFGYVNLTILLGKVRLFGCELNSKSPRTVAVFGASDQKPFMIETEKIDVSLNLESLKEAFNLHNILIEDWQSFFATIQNNDTVLFVENVSLPSIFSAKHYLPSNILPKIENLQSAFTEVSQSVFCAINGTSLNCLESSPEWDSMPLGGRTVIVGGKGLGKSSLGKYMVNQLINSNAAVLWLDLDPGQGEFIPPGSVGFNVITEPVLGPNYTHCTVPNRAIHLGEVDVNRCCTNYVTAVQLLIKLADNDFASMPWIINTMGYTKGVGLLLTKTVIQAVSPNHVIEITSPLASNNFKAHLTPSVVNEIDCSMFPWSATSQVDYRLIIISAASQALNSKTGKKDRNLMLLSYLSGMLSPPLHYFHCVQPYSIPFRSLWIGVSSPISPNDILFALNGTLVNLCSFDPADSQKCDQFEVEDQQDSWFRLIMNPPVLLSLGLGIVRGIDTETRNLFLITPTPNDLLSQVNMITMSSVQLPAELFLNQEGVEGEVPYTTKNTGERSMATVKRLFQSPRIANVAQREECEAI